MSHKPTRQLLFSDDIPPPTDRQIQPRSPATQEKHANVLRWVANLTMSDSPMPPVDQNVPALPPPGQVYSLPPAGSQAKQKLPFLSEERLEQLVASSVKNIVRFLPYTDDVGPYGTGQLYAPSLGWVFRVTPARALPSTTMQDRFDVTGGGFPGHPGRDKQEKSEQQIVQEKERVPHHIMRDAIPAVWAPAVVPFVWRPKVDSHERMPSSHGNTLQSIDSVLRGGALSSGRKEHTRGKSSISPYRPDNDFVPNSNTGSFVLSHYTIQKLQGPLTVDYESLDPKPDSMGTLVSLSNYRPGQRVLRFDPATNRLWACVPCSPSTKARELDSCDHCCRPPRNIFEPECLCRFHSYFFVTGEFLGFSERAELERLDIESPNTVLGVADMLRFVTRVRARVLQWRSELKESAAMPGTEDGMQNTGDRVDRGRARERQ